MNQHNFFCYTRTENEKTFKDCFNLNMFIRSIENEDGTMSVLLNDFHERVNQVPDVNPKTNKIVGFKNIRETMQSHIILNKEDKERFLNL